MTYPSAPAKQELIAWTASYIPPHYMPHREQQQEDLNLFKHKKTYTDLNTSLINTDCELQSINT